MLHVYGNNYHYEMFIVIHDIKTKFVIQYKNCKNTQTLFE